MAKYGISYMGSKQSIADKVIKVFPKARNFYDLFGGGFSITHAMLLRRSKDFKTFHFNEIKSNTVELIKKAILGEFNYNVFKPKFICREEFFESINDPYIRCIWSFGNNQRDYLFSKKIEPYKKSMHNAIVFNKFNDLAQKILGCQSFKDGYSIRDRRIYFRSRIEYFRLNGIPKFLIPFLNQKQCNTLLSKPNDYYQLKKLHHLDRLEKLQQLEQLERLQQLEQLERLEKLNFSSKSYDKVEIKEDSIIYCDPPYKGTVDYGNAFDTDKFLDWCHNQSHPVFISEYEISDKRFRKIKTIKKMSLLSYEKEKRKIKEENIYINKTCQDKFMTKI